MFEAKFDELGAITVVDLDQSTLTDWGWQRSIKENISVRFIRGKKAQSARSCFDEFAASLQFPYYFGENWDALADCMTDFSWIDREKLLIIIFDSPSLLQDAPRNNFELLVKILNSATEQREISFAAVPDAQPLQIKTVMQTTPNLKDSLQKMITGSD
jgi:RNAse (barnase) inhibitor barstar